MTLTDEQKKSLQLVVNAARQRADDLEASEKTARASKLNGIADIHERSWKHLMAAIGDVNRLITGTP